MNEVEQLRTDTKKALGLLAHALGAAVGAKPILLNLTDNWKAAMTQGQAADGFDELAMAMLLTLSSLALKQSPHDSEVKELYSALRPGRRH